ncbi:hypothetical protein QE441_001571 [Chryseobacterium sp. SORGH_AS909]|uniref:Uncharacterized protein n=1 Tax=Chryseobacterium camelliae TaxID=1265445 RepID=A0ABU0TMZ9_9FLAO|nr:hypothetical protein [Chryseobacterium camelliae]MDQ1102341.1 hypothetical protein [Chryseobacterium sp. SORGH_AS_1048]MDR6085777.1 hypothetical protein [Chryseobacterium sp. SORGH_AS_0909]MDT3407732.1 hypothetical protein [Pseudacidovorax intermedius]
MQLFRRLTRMTIRASLPSNNKLTITLKFFITRQVLSLRLNIFESDKNNILKN